MFLFYHNQAAQLVWRDEYLDLNYWNPGCSAVLQQSVFSHVFVLFSSQPIVSPAVALFDLELLSSFSMVDLVGNLASAIACFAELVTG